MTLLFAAGALSMVAQVVVLRELVAALYGVELLYVLALGAWLAGTAAGAACGRRVSPSPGLAAAGCVTLALLVPAEVIVIRMAGPAAGAVPGAYLPFPAQLAWIAVATVLPAALCGLLFPVLAALAGRRGWSAGRSYAVESAGAAVAGAAVTVAMGLGASTVQMAILAAGGGVAAAILAAGRWTRRRRIAASLLVAVIVGVSVWKAKPLDLALLRSMYPAIVDAADTPYARIVISRTGSQVAVAENGAFAFDTEGTNAEAFADLAAVQHARPLRALVIGGGAEGVARALARHGIAAVEDLEVDQRAFELVGTATRADGNPAPAARPVSVIFEEPRRFLERSGSYDLILVAAGEPTSGASSRFYTCEFFGQLARRLTRGGVVAIRLAAAENVWPAPLVRRTASIVGALKQEFPAVEMLAGATLYLFASNEPLTVDPVVLSSRLTGRGLQPRLITPPYLHYLYTNDRRAEVERLIQSLPAVGPNRDGAPVCYQYAAMTWLSKFYPRLAATSDGPSPVRRPVVWIAMAGLALGAAVWVRRSGNRRLGACVGVVGFVGMVLETVLLLRYQIRNGVVYQQVGWLLTCFMAGTAAGAFAAGGAGNGRAWSRRAGTIPFLALGVTLSAWAAIAWAPATSGLAGTSVLLAAAGAAVGASFAVAARAWEGRASGAVPMLYGADVAGGAAGAVAAALLLVPAAGLDGSALVTVAAAAALLLVVPYSASGGR